MRVKLDSTKCQGHGQCYYLCPEVFHPDVEGFSVVVAQTVPPGLQVSARRAGESCPERAIRVEDD